MTMLSPVAVHLQTSRREARRLLQRAERPYVVSLGNLAFAAFVLFVAAVAGGYAFRLWQVAVT